MGALVLVHACQFTLLQQLVGLALNGPRLCLTLPRKPMEIVYLHTSQVKGDHNYEQIHTLVYCI